jgi:hypothetical protein
MRSETESGLSLISRVWRQCVCAKPKERDYTPRGSSRRPEGDHTV